MTAPQKASAPLTSLERRRLPASRAERPRDPANVSDAKWQRLRQELIDGLGPVGHLVRDIMNRSILAIACVKSKPTISSFASFVIAAA